MKIKSALRPALLLGAIGISLLSAPSHAQTKAQSGEFSVQNFQPAPGTKNFLGVETLRMDGNWGYSVGLVYNYAKNPFVLRSCVSQTNCTGANRTDIPVISDMMAWDLLAAVSPIRRLQIGLRLPLTYVSGSGIDVSTGQGVQGGIKKFGVGDPTVEGKVRLWGNANDPYVVGLAADLSFPVGHAFSDQANGKSYFLGNSSPVTGGLRGIFDGAVGPLQFGINLRGVFRQGVTFPSEGASNAKGNPATVGPVDFRYGAGLGYKVSPIFRVLAEGFGSTQFSARNGTNTLEVDGAVEFTPLQSRLVIRAGGGAGILQGIGVPAARAFIGFAFANEVGDMDGDGIPDDVDKCPTIPEDKDGFEDEDGCPDPDNDGDKIPDELDKCPNMPETVNGFQDEDGCPDEVPDRDGDGIPDHLDKCPDAGGKFVIRTPGPYYGCPDRDGDMIPDHLDKCPDEKEDTDGFQDEDGCPDPDNDGDKIPDELDECPDQPETYNGYKDEDGCPDEVPGAPPTPKVEISESEIKIMDKVEFATGKDVIQGARSFQVLDVVAAIMKARTEIALVEVGGHTDNVGAAIGNRKLSQKRAEAVVRYLVTKGIDKARLTAKGYGPDKPIADNKTADGKQKNRRVEFVIMKKDAPPPKAPPPPKK
jgi:outer membrane protein OmpA-like peptidoglycan-associated protein